MKGGLSCLRSDDKKGFSLGYVVPRCIAKARWGGWRGKCGFFFSKPRTPTSLQGTQNLGPRSRREQTFAGWSFYLSRGTIALGIHTSPVVYEPLLMLFLGQIEDRAAIEFAVNSFSSVLHSLMRFGRLFFSCDTCQVRRKWGSIPGVHNNIIAINRFGSANSITYTPRTKAPSGNSPVFSVV